jgi:DNA-binding transcriptional LysR family regulator
MLDVDVKMLSILQEIYRTRSVSQAAEHVGLSQPTVSITLRKLRKRFRDPLFVRTSKGMEPTPRATELLNGVSEALGLLAHALQSHVPFDAKRSEHYFRICMTDISQIVLLPRLLNHLKEVAPFVRVEVFDISGAAPSLLEAGEADLAIGFMPQLESGFFQQRLFPQRFVCMVRARHPRIRGRLGLKQFVAESHIQVATTGTGHGIVDKVLRERRIERRIALRVPNFLGIGRVVANTDLLAIVPEILVSTLADELRIRALKAPVAFPTYAVKQHWHARFHHDPRNQWLRAVVARLFVPSAMSAR